MLDDFDQANRCQILFDFVVHVLLEVVVVVVVVDPTYTQGRNIYLYGRWGRGNQTKS